MDDEFHEALMNAKTPEEYLHIIDEAEKIQIEQEEAEAEEERKQAEAEQAATTAEKATGAGCRNCRCRGSECCSSCCRGSGRLRQTVCGCCDGLSYRYCPYLYGGRSPGAESRCYGDRY